MTFHSDEAIRHIEALKAQSLGQLLLKTSRLFQDAALTKLSTQLGFPLRPSHLSLLPHLDFHGTRLTTLANRLGHSKQAIGQLVEELVEAGMLAKMPDPADGRARLIHLVRTPGRRIEDGLDALAQVEHLFEGRISTARLEVMRETLGMMVEVLQELAPSEGES